MKVHHLSRRLSSLVNISDAFEVLTAQMEGPKALLETASISSKEHQNSVMMLSAALRVHCIGERVIFTALNVNGRQLLPALSKLVSVVEQTQDYLIARYEHTQLNNTLDEFDKLKAPNVFDSLRQLLQLVTTQTHDDISTQLIGNFAFDCFNLFESVNGAFNCQNSADNENTLRDNEQDADIYFDFYLADRLLMVDHKNHHARLISKIFEGENAQSIINDYQQKIAEDEQTLHQCIKNQKEIPLKNNQNNDEISVNLSDEHYIDLVEQVKTHIKKGDVFQIVVARQFALLCDDAYTAYQYLKVSNPSPYMFYIKGIDYELFGASPESAVKVEAKQNKLSIYPIAGTRRRGLDDLGNINADLDARIEMELKNDEKEKAEHAMLVDLARNDVAKVCCAGSRVIERLMEVDRYSHVMHLVSKVSGTLRPEQDALSAYQACMNMGTLTGAPKVKAMQLIHQYEPLSRGFYGGATGYLNAQGDMDTAIVIRSAFVKDNQAIVSAGAGIVHDSVPELEVKETRDKAAAVIRAVQATQSKEVS